MGESQSQGGVGLKAGTWSSLQNYKFHNDLRIARIFETLCREWQHTLAYRALVGDKAWIGNARVNDPGISVQVFVL